jgi:hypothetical protein
MKKLFKTRTTLFIAFIALERTIKHMYDLFGPNVINVQDYKAAYVNVFGNAADFPDIAILNGVTP